jgi:dolichyl-phosphate beta-glucosyltransferase
LQSLSIVIPAYNEARRLGATLETILNYTSRLGLSFVELIVVDDGSTDATAAIAGDFQSRYSTVRLVKNPGNRGKGYAVRHGMREAHGEWVLFADADLSSPIDELEKLSCASESQNAAGAIGSRALDRSLIGVRQSVFRETTGRFFNWVMRSITGLSFLDTQCGFKLFRADAARLASRLQQIDGFGFDVEILYILDKHGFKILEVPVRWNNVEGTKVSLWNGLAAFLDPLTVRWHDWRGDYARTMEATK